ncbi:MAG: alpha/beta hydrolase family protein [Polyangia bacterium]
MQAALWTLLALGYGATHAPMAAWHPSLWPAGKLPLVVISHGAGGSERGHHDTAEYLAEHGFIVVAPRHVGDNVEDQSAQGTPRMWRDRPLQLRAAIDAALADPTMGPHIDRARIGAFGFSAGGYTVLVAAGAVADLQRAQHHCRAHREDAFCRETHDGDSLVGVAEPIVHARDPRLKAAVVAAPVGAFFDDVALADVKIPVRLYRAGADALLTHPYHAERVHARLPSTHDYVVVPGAGHYAFLAPFPPSLKSKVGAPAEDPPGFDRAAFHARLNAELAAFFARAL